MKSPLKVIDPRWSGGDHNRVMSPHRIRLIAAMTAAGFFFLLSPAAADAASLWTRKKAEYDRIINNVALEHGLDADFIHAVIKAESAYNRWAVSRAGAQGLMQLMPATAVAYGVRDVWDPEQNIRGGVKFLKALWKLYDGNVKKILAAYNAGQEAVKKYGGIPPYVETRTYINRVLATYQAPPSGMRTKIYEIKDASGRIILTNDPRLAASAARGVS